MSDALDDLPPRDEDKPIRVYTCKQCGERGHNSRSCGKPKPDRPKRRGTPKQSRGPR